MRRFARTIPPTTKSKPINTSVNESLPVAGNKGGVTTVVVVGETVVVVVGETVVVVVGVEPAMATVTD